MIEIQPQTNLFGEVERKKFVLFANKKNTIFCNQLESGVVDTPVIISEFESILIEEKFTGHLLNTRYGYLLDTGYYDSPEYKALLPDEADRLEPSCEWRQVDFSSGNWRIEKGKISNGWRKVPLSNFSGLELDTISRCFYYNTKYNYFKLVINDLKVYIVGEFE